MAAWYEDPLGNQKRIAETFREACKIAEDHGERLAAEGEICWGGMHSWRKMVQLLEMVERPQTLGFQADMAHTMLYVLGYNAPRDRLLPEDYDWKNQTYVESDIEDWQPDGTGKKVRMNCERWNCNSLDWFTLWMQSLPGMENNLAYQGAPLNNWWMFIGDFDGAMKAKQRLVEKR